MYSMLFTTTMYPEYMYLIKKEIDQKEKAMEDMINAEIKRQEKIGGLEDVEGEELPQEQEVEQSDRISLLNGEDDTNNWFTGFEQKLGITISSKMALKLQPERVSL